MIPEGAEQCDDANANQCDGCFDTCQTGDILVSLGSYDPTTKKLPILVHNCVNLYGFQMDLSGVNITLVSGGAAAQKGWLVGSNNTTILGFHLQLVPIPPASTGPQVLTEITIDPPVQPGATEVCLIADQSLLMSDMNGIAIATAAGACITI